MLRLEAQLAQPGEEAPLQPFGEGLQEHRQPVQVHAQLVTEDVCRIGELGREFRGEFGGGQAKVLIGRLGDSL